MIRRLFLLAIATLSFSACSLETGKQWYKPGDNYTVAEFQRDETACTKNRVLDEWCARLDRNPAQIERTVGINASEVENSQAYLDAGATHLIVMTGHPFDLDPVRRLLDIARS